MSGPLESKLRIVRDEGRSCLVGYVTGGVAGWLDAVRAVAAAGADAVEIGIPFSDPVMDGPTIQEASDKALQAGATPESILNEVRSVDVDVPLAVMTYYNIAFHMASTASRTVWSKQASPGLSFPTSRSRRPDPGVRPPTRPEWKP